MSEAHAGPASASERPGDGVRGRSPRVETSEAHAGDGAIEQAAPAPPTLYGCPVVEARGQTVIHATRDGYVAAIKAALDDGYTTCVDLTAVDYLRTPATGLPDGVTAERFEVVVNLLDMAARRRLRVRVQVPAGDPTAPTLFDVHPGTEAMEREVFDLLGIVFDGHPDLTRILMPEDWEGHPLRKDYEIGAIPVQFKDAPS